MIVAISARAADVLPVNGPEGFWSPLAVVLALAGVAALALVARWISGGRPPSGASAPPPPMRRADDDVDDADAGPSKGGWS